MEENKLQLYSSEELLAKFDIEKLDPKRLPETIILEGHRLGYLAMSYQDRVAISKRLVKLAQFMRSAGYSVTASNNYGRGSFSYLYQRTEATAEAVKDPIARLPDSSKAPPAKGSIEESSAERAVLDSKRIIDV